MAVETRNIGLSLGADICWAAAYEALLEELNLHIEHGDNIVRFAVERVRVEPFDLRARPKYDLVLDRVTHWYMTTREWMKKITLMDGVYTLNNPWAIQAYEKHTTYCAMMRLGLPIPETWMLPPKVNKDTGDEATMVRKYNKLFDLGGVGDKVGEREGMRVVGGGGGEEDERAVWGIERREDEGGGLGAVVTIEGGLGVPCGGEVRASGDGEPEES